MADTKISAMPAAATLDGTEIAPLVQAGANVQDTVLNIVNETIATAPATFRTTLGLGTMAVQNATNVNITGGTAPTSILTGTLGETHGGTGQSTYPLGDILYGSATNTLSKLAGNTTTTSKFLKQVGTGSVSAAPEWGVISPSDINTQYGAFHFDNGSTLSANLAIGTTTSMSVTDTSQFASSGNVLVGDEVITFTGKTATTLTGLTRGVAGTSASAHTSGAAVTSAQIAAANTATPVRLNLTDFSNGVTVVSETNVTFAIGGTYNVQFSVQLINASNANDNAAFWFSQNGTNIADSSSIATTIKKDGTTVGATIIAANLFVSVSAGDYVTLNWSTTTGNSILVTYPLSASSPVRPASPAVILTVNQVS